MQARAHASCAITTGGLRYRPPIPSDGSAMWRLARSVGLDLNSPYAYVLWGDHFPGSSSVAVTDAGEVVGFVTGFHPPRDPTTLFIWQVGVAPELRGRGVAGQMLDELVTRNAVRWLEATVTPSNEASAALFRGTASRHGTAVDETLAYPRDWFPEDHEPELRFRIGPFEEGRPGSTTKPSAS